MSLSTTVLCLILILLIHKISADLKFHVFWIRALIEFYEHENPEHNTCFPMKKMLNEPTILEY